MAGYQAYPGCNSSRDETPRPNARVKPEAEEFANRGKGSLDLFASSPRYIEEPKKTPRCQGGDARSNYEVGRHGTVSSLLYGQASPTFETGAPRCVKEEARPIAEGHQGRQTAALFSSYGRLTPQCPGPARVKHEAEATAEQHKGGRMNCLLHDPNKLPNSARPVPRVKSEAGANAELDRGGQMNKTIHSYGSQSARPTYMPRVKPEASDNAVKGKGYVGTLMGKYGKLNLDEKPNPKVRGIGQDNASLDQGGRMSRLMHEGDRMHPDPKPPPRANSKAAKHIVKVSRGQIGQIFAEQGKRQTVSAPGLRKSQPLKVY